MNRTNDAVNYGFSAAKTDPHPFSLMDWIDWLDSIVGGDQKKY